jgi:hypothetical protein
VLEKVAQEADLSRGLVVPVIGRLRPLKGGGWQPQHQLRGPLDLALLVLVFWSSEVRSPSLCRHRKHWCRFRVSLYSTRQKLQQDWADPVWGSLPQQYRWGQQFGC